MSARARLRQTAFRRVFSDLRERSRGSISLALVGACTAFYLLVVGLDLLHLLSQQQVISILGLSAAGILQSHRYYQFLTAPLLHASAGHLLFNMLSLWMLGPDVEKTLGRRKYLTLSVLCAASSMAGFLLLSAGTSGVVIGYSGVIFGLLVAQALLLPDRVLAFYGIFPVKMKYAALLLGVVELYFTLAPGATTVAHSAHVFGAGAAFVYLRTVCPSRPMGAAPEPAPQAPPPLPARRRIARDIPREL